MAASSLGGQPTVHESRASLSWEGTTLLFGSGKPGGEGPSDIYISTRDKLTGQP